MVTAILLGVVFVLWVLGGYLMSILVPLIEDAAEREGISISDGMKVLMVAVWPYFVVREIYMEEENDSGV